MSLKDKITLSVKGQVTDGDETKVFDWLNAVLDAGIIAGLGFFSTLAGIGLTMGTVADACLPAGIAAAVQFFTTLAIKRELVRKQ